jgi:hypothetical protein
MTSADPAAGASFARSRISPTADRPRSAFRDVITTVAPVRTSAIAVSLPIPVLPPVMTTTFPAIGRPSDPSRLSSLM